MPDKNTINIHGDLNVEGDFVAGDKHQTIIQKFFNIFKSDSETLEQRNRRILLGHVENAWIKGVLDASLGETAKIGDFLAKQSPPTSNTASLSAPTAQPYSNFTPCSKPKPRALAAWSV